MAVPSYGADQMRDLITRALMEVQNPSPRTQMPGGGVGAPTQSPVVPPGAAAGPMPPGMGGAPSPQMPPGGGGVQGPTGPQMPQAPGSLAPMPVGPPQVPPPQMGGAPMPPVPRSQNIVGMPPPDAGMIPGTQIPVPQGRY